MFIKILIYYDILTLIVITVVISEENHTTFFEFNRIVFSFSSAKSYRRIL